MNTVQAANPDIVSSYSAGKSYESRDLKVLVIKTPTSKKSIWIGRKIIQFQAAPTALPVEIKSKKTWV